MEPEGLAKEDPPYLSTPPGGLYTKINYFLPSWLRYV